MWAWLRNTASRGRTGVPASLRRMRARMRSRMSSLVLTFIVLRSTGVPWPVSPSWRSRSPLLGSAGGAGLAGLLLQDLAHVADPLLLVRVGLAEAADLRRHLAHLL